MIYPDLSWFILIYPGIVESNQGSIFDLDIDMIPDLSGDMNPDLIFNWKIDLIPGWFINLINQLMYDTNPGLIIDRFHDFVIDS